MRLDVLGQTILQDVHGYAGFENAVIAGGYCRDQILGGKFKDVDIFVPTPEIADFKRFLEKLPDEWVLLNRNPIQKHQRRNGGHYELVERVDEILNFKFMEAVDIQIILSKYENNEKFGQAVVEDFSYGIDQAYSNGEDITVTGIFADDKADGYATLVAKGVDQYNLPGHMAKYFRLNEKYPEMFVWRCPSIEFKDAPKDQGLFRPKKFAQNVRDFRNVQWEPARRNFEIQEEDLALDNVRRAIDFLEAQNVPPPINNPDDPHEIPQEE